MDKLALLNAGYTIQAEIDRLQHGLPIAEAKAPSQLERMQKRKAYTAKINELRAQLKAINTAIHAG